MGHFLRTKKNLMSTAAVVITSAIIAAIAPQAAQAQPTATDELLKSNEALECYFTGFFRGQKGDARSWQVLRPLYEVDGVEALETPLGAHVISREALLSGKTQFEFRTDSPDGNAKNADKQDALVVSFGIWRNSETQRASRVEVELNYRSKHWYGDEEKVKIGSFSFAPRNLLEEFYSIEWSSMPKGSKMGLFKMECEVVSVE